MSVRPLEDERYVIEYGRTCPLANELGQNLGI